MSDSLYIVMPAYNEQENILRAIKAWYPIVEEIGGASRLVVMDDGSRDDTLAIMRQFALSHPQFVSLSHENAGHGATCLDLYHYAISNSCDFVFQTDSDGQTDPALFPDFWCDRHKYDMIIGWRRDRQDGAPRIFISRMLRLVIRMMFHVHVLDANCPFRLMSSQSLAENIAYIPNGFALSNVALSAVYAKKGQAVSWRTVPFLPRQGG